ncbi:MAG: hypothetical protein WKF96_25330 [Solirubrobacteraceae bacterium]
MLLYALAVGDDRSRGAAWWELWGNVHYQGSVYSASLPAAHVLLALARWEAFPDRAQALLLLREMVTSTDPRVRPPERPALLSGLRSLVSEHEHELFASWPAEPTDVRRALLWLLTCDEALAARWSALVTAVLPDDLADAWPLAFERDAALEDEQYDRLCDLEGWVCG